MSNFPQKRDFFIGVLDFCVFSESFQGISLSVGLIMDSDAPER